MIITEFAPAKVNLSLHIIGRRNDGYHEMQSLVVFADIGDTLSFQSADTTALTISGKYGNGLSTIDNLVVQAHTAVETFIGKPLSCNIHLEKNLPPASGVGGGSSDAAATIRGLNRLFSLNLSTADQYNIAKTLGADVPVCLTCQPCWMCGIGNILHPVTLTDRFVIDLLFCGFAVPTPDVFASYRDSNSKFSPEIFPLSQEISLADIKQMHNDLLQPCITNHPEIKDLLNTAKSSNCLHSGLSGSGGTVFRLMQIND